MAGLQAVLVLCLSVLLSLWSASLQSVRGELSPRVNTAYGCVQPNLRMLRMQSKIVNLLLKYYEVNRKKKSWQLNRKAVTHGTL